MRCVPSILSSVLAVSVLAPIALAHPGGGDAKDSALTLPTSVRSPQSLPYNVLGGDVALVTASTCVAGVRGADGAASNQGAVESFELQSDGWTFIERVQPTGLAAGDQFGEVVAGNAAWLAASATRHDASGADAGAVWVYHREGALWRFPQKLVPGMGADGARFGSALAMSDDRLAIGSQSAAGGTVTIYRLIGQSWQFEQTIANPSPGLGDRFGDALALDAERLIVGDPLDDTNTTDRGAVFVFTNTGRSWQLASTLSPLSTADRQYFGRSLALTATRLAIGANGADAADGTSASGMVEVFDLLGGNWLRAAELRPAPAVVGGHFGWDLALDDDTIVVGEPGFGSESEGALIGRVHVFERQLSGLWLPLARIQAVTAATNDLFGASVACEGGRMVASAPGREGQRGEVLAVDLAIDCDQDQMPDALQIAADAALDCNGDLVLDACQPDSDVDGVPNACDCPADLNGDGIVGSVDVSLLLANWNRFGQCSADIDGDGWVTAGDLSLLLVRWGGCK